MLTSNPVAVHHVQSAAMRLQHSANERQLVPLPVPDRSVRAAPTLVPTLSHSDQRSITVEPTFSPRKSMAPSCRSAPYFMEFVHNSPRASATARDGCSETDTSGSAPNFKTALGSSNTPTKAAINAGSRSGPPRPYPKCASEQLPIS